MVDWIKTNKRKILFSALGTLGVFVFFYFFGVIQEIQYQIYPTTRVYPSLSQEIEEIEFNNKGSVNYSPENENSVTLWIPRAYLTNFPENEGNPGHQFARLEVEVETLKPWTTFVTQLPQKSYGSRAEELALRKKRIYVKLGLGSRSAGPFMNGHALVAFLQQLLRDAEQSGFLNQFTRFDSKSGSWGYFYLVPNKRLKKGATPIYFRCFTKQTKNTFCNGYTVLFESVKVEYSVPRDEIEHWSYWDKQVEELVREFLTFPEKSTNFSPKLPPSSAF